MLGFSGCDFLSTTSGRTPATLVSSAAGGGGAAYTSLSGGSSLISEKLLRTAAAGLFSSSAIIGSTAKLGLGFGSSTGADDAAMFGNELAAEIDCEAAP